MIQIVKESSPTLIQLGYEELSFDVFHSTFLELLALLNVNNLTHESLEVKFNEEGGTGEYIVWFCRLLTSLFVKTHPDRFTPFLEYGDNINNFCAREIEPVGVECEQIQIIALSEQLEVGVKIEYLDGEDFDEKSGLNSIKVNMESKNDAEVVLLFRPGHYDIIYE
mmetsp:Transcript_39/g.52  ORF Transcript_39/g.52 Transcript_39/m.52 type:complete len:166 (+) Transcript_39:324-821(+)